MSSFHVGNVLFGICLMKINHEAYLVEGVGPHTDSEPEGLRPSGVVVDSPTTFGGYHSCLFFSLIDFSIVREP